MPVTIGIIYPPPEVRSIVDKTATFVARNGPEFEEKIRGNEITNTKFNFLNQNDPYHAYYQHKVREIAEGRDASDTKTSLPQAALNNAIQSNMQNLSLSVKTADTQMKIIEQIIIPKEPPTDPEFIVDAPSIMPMDIDVIKLTAQFVARNGGPFRTNLMNKESRNPLFDFLKPQHSHFTFFTRLVEQYSKVFLPPKDLLIHLRKELDNPFQVLADVSYRVEWQKIQLREKAKIDEMIEKERVAYAQIDWHDFVVVETVDYQPNEQGNFPPPTTPADVGARTMQLERIETSAPEGSKIDYNSKLMMNRIIDDESRIEISSLSAAQNQIEIAPVVDTTNKVTLLVDKNIDSVAMDEDSDEEKSKHSQNQKPTKKDLPLPPNPENVIIKHNYDPKASKHALHKTQMADNYFKSPLTGELIPAASMSEHMRISMLDPKWIEQKQREKKEREDQEEVLAGGFNIEENLKRLAEYRSDVFGSGADEVLIGKKVGEEEEALNNDIIWDEQAVIEKGPKRGVSELSAGQGIADEDKWGNMPPQQMMPPQMQQQMHQQQQHNIMQQQYKLINTPSGPPQMGQQMNQQIRPPPMQPPMHQQPMYEQPRESAQLNELIEEPSNKRQKTEDQFMSESEFLALNGGKGPIRFNVQVPNMPDKPEWNLKGQLIPFTMALTESVASIKNKLAEFLGMPIAKQKLQYEGLFVKDTNTLAFYNLTDNVILALQTKERGGRKK